jgi:hypothetical protein
VDRTFHSTTLKVSRYRVASVWVISSVPFEQGKARRSTDDEVVTTGLLVCHNAACGGSNRWREQRKPDCRHENQPDSTQST